jgi:hypothetical protein
MKNNQSTHHTRDVTSVQRSCCPSHFLYRVTHREYVYVCIHTEHIVRTRSITQVVRRISLTIVVFLFLVFFDDFTRCLSNNSKVISIVSKQWTVRLISMTSSVRRWLNIEWYFVEKSIISLFTQHVIVIDSIAHRSCTRWTASHHRWLTRSLERMPLVWLLSNVRTTMFHSFVLFDRLSIIVNVKTQFYCQCS